MANIPDEWRFKESLIKYLETECKYISKVKFAERGQHILQISVVSQINGLKDKHHEINSIDAEKAHDKIQHSIIAKILEKVGLEGTYLNIRTLINVKTTS